MIWDEITAHLQANGHPGLYVGSLPATTPDDAFVLWEYGGEEPIHVKGQQAPILELPRFQIRTRSKSYSVGRLKAERIHRALIGFSGQISGVGYGSIRSNESPYLLERDGSNRPIFVCNYKVVKELSPLS